MVAPVRARPGQTVSTPSPPSDEDQGSYPAEITREQFEWLQERAAQHRRRWAEHKAALACNQKS
jgi:hypothetical protein